MSVTELEEVLVAEELTDEEVELVKEKVWCDAKRAVTARQKVVEEEEEDGGEDESEGVKEEDEDEDEPVHSSGLSVKAKGK